MSEAVLSTVTIGLCLNEHFLSIICSVRKKKEKRCFRMCKMNRFSLNEVRTAAFERFYSFKSFIYGEMKECRSIIVDSARDV